MKTNRPSFISALDPELEFISQQRENNPKLEGEYIILDHLIIRVETAHSYEHLEASALAVGKQIAKIKQKVKQ